MTFGKDWVAAEASERVDEALCAPGFGVAVVGAVEAVDPLADAEVLAAVDPLADAGALEAAAVEPD